MASLTLSRKQLEQLNKIVEHFNEVEHFTIENPDTSAIGSTMQVRFDLIETQNITLVDTVVDITDIRTW
jgi:Asp-tRNA(Asn)/Glu-tRNA(Gln) amidotransferase C subunit